MAKNGMKIEISKLMDGAWLAHAGVKGTPVPANALIDAGNVNLAILAMINSGEFELRVKPVVTLVNYPQGSKNYFPVVKFVAPAGTKIGNVAIAKTEKVFELEHFRVGNKEARPSALREEEIVKGALTALNEKLFPPSDLTDRPIPQTEANDKDRAIARKVMAKLGNDMGKFLEVSKVASMLGWDYVDEHYEALVK